MIEMNSKESNETTVTLGSITKGTANVSACERVDYLFL